MLPELLLALLLELLLELLALQRLRLCRWQHRGHSGCGSAAVAVLQEGQYNVFLTSLA